MAASIVIAALGTLCGLAGGFAFARWSARESPPPAQSGVLRHDMRGILAPALLVADRLIAHEDPAIRRAGEVVLRTVERAVERLEKNSA